MKPIVAVVAGGHPMFLDLLSTWLAARVEVRVVAVAGDVHTAVAACVGHRPDLLVLEPTALAEVFDVFVRIGRGLQTAGIAAELGISPQTVETHRKSVIKKLRANGANLVRIAALYVAANGHREALAGR